MPMHVQYENKCIISHNRIGGVMVSVLASSVVDIGFKPKTIKLVFVAICLPADCCFSELALWKSNSTCWSRTKRISFIINLFSSWYSWKFAELALNNNHSPTQKSHSTKNKLETRAQWIHVVFFFIMIPIVFNNE